MAKKAFVLSTRRQRDVSSFLAVQKFKMAIKKHFITYWLKAFSSDTPQSTKLQDKGPKEHDEKYLPSC